MSWEQGLPESTEGTQPWRLASDTTIKFLLRVVQSCLGSAVNGSKGSTRAEY